MGTLVVALLGGLVVCVVTFVALVYFAPKP
jgi:hypothetical protein